MGAQEMENQRTLIFTYGTLKRGFPNHILLQEMFATGDAAFVGVYLTADKLPLVCGPYKVPFLLNFPGSGDRVVGELYAVSNRALARMDELEGTIRGHYERLPVKLRSANGSDEEREGKEEVAAEAYYGHRNYAAEMWKRNGEKGFSNYTEKEAKGYVKRKERPQQISFLDQIQLFLSSS